MILTEIPRRLADRWAWPISKPVPVVTPPPKPERPIPTADHAELEALLASIPNDAESLDYDRWRNVIFAIHHATEGSDEGLALAHEFSARSPKYDPDFLDSRVWPYITSDRDSAITIETLRFMARQHEDPMDDFEVLPDLPPTPTAEGLPTRFKVLDEAEILQRPRPRWLVKGVIPDAELVVLYGQSTAGKSFVALDLFAAVARGVPWRGLKTQQRSVVYLAAEGQGGFRNRLEAYRQHHNESSGLRVILDAPNFTKAADPTAVGEQIIAAGGAGVIVVDTLAQVAPGADENSAEDMGRVLLACRHLRRATGALIVLIHHAGKDLTKGARGWSGLKAAADAEIEVSRLDSQRWVRLSKSKDGEDGAEYPFRLLPVLLGQDEDGDEITSCVIEHITQAERGARAEPKGKVERVIWRLAHELAEIGDASVPVDVLLTEAARGLSHDPQKGRDRRREVANRALLSLVEAGTLNVLDNVVTIPEA